MYRIQIKTVWVDVLSPAVVALVLVSALVAVVSPRSIGHRLSNLELENAGFSDTYLISSKSEPDKVYVLNRRDSSVRRSDRKLPGRKWNVFRFGGEADASLPDTWLVQSKRKGKGTVLFVPLINVKDWSYPFLYKFVRTHRKELNLPNVEWTQLFVNRIYQGLYLKVALPFDARKKDGGSGILRELLTVRDNRLTYINTRFDDTGGLYTSSVAEGLFPTLEAPAPTLAWLSQRCPVVGSTFLMSARSPYEISLLPLPVSLPDQFQTKNGRLPGGFEDDRIRQWTTQVRRAQRRNPSPFSEAEVAALKTEFGQYAESFRNALRAQGALHETTMGLRAELPTRQAAASDLQLSLGRL